MTTEVSGSEAGTRAAGGGAAVCSCLVDPGHGEPVVGAAGAVAGHRAASRVGTHVCMQGHLVRPGAVDLHGGSGPPSGPHHPGVGVLDVRPPTGRTNGYRPVSV